MKQRTKLSLIIAILLTCIASSIHLYAQIPSVEPWRVASRGGVNTLYCYLRIHGIQWQYDAMLQDTVNSDNTNHTALTLSRLSAKHGLPLRPVSLTMDELLLCPLPVIVHIDGSSPEMGGFLMIYSFGKNKMGYLNGPSVTIHDMNNVDFRRVWSGTALLPKKRPQWDLLFGCVGLAVGFLSVAVHRLLHCRSAVSTLDT